MLQAASRSSRLSNESPCGDLARGADAAARGRIGVEGAELVRVLAVAKVGLLLDHHRQARREDRARGGVQIARDLRVVGGGHGERLTRQLLARLGADAAERFDVAQDRCVLRRARYRGDSRKVLGRRAEERHAADVDLLEGLVEVGARIADGLGEGIEVDDDDVDLLDPVLGQLGDVVRQVAPCEQPSEDLRVKGLDAPSEDLARIGQVADRLDPLEAGLGQVCASSIGGEDVRAGIGQAAGKLDDAFTVTDGEKGAQSTDSG